MCLCVYVYTYIHPLFGKIHFVISMLSLGTTSMITVMLLVAHACSYTICPSITISQYTYPLNQMTTHDNIPTVLDNSIVEISLCELVQCDGTLTYITKIESDTCTSYTSSIAPLQSRYSMIDESAPSQGIQVEYLPYDEANGTQVRTVRLSIFCLSEVEGRTQCSESSGPNTTTLECSVHLQMGCPELMVNACWVYFDHHSLVMAIFLWLAAVFILFCGYFAIRATIFLVGVMTGTFASTIFIAQNYHDFVLQSDAVFIFVLCLAVFLGACFGVTLLTLPRLGYFNIGLWVAVTISLMLQNSVYYLTGSLLAFYITLGVLSLLVGVVSLLKFRMFIMVASAIVGSFWVIRPIGFFLPGYPNEFFSGDNFQLSITTPWEFYLYLISIILLIIMGISFQYCLSAKFKKSKHPNAAYYFEDDDPLREKIKKLFQFEGLQEALHSGKEQLVFLKNLVLDSDDEGEENEEQDGQGIEMVEMRERESDESMQRMKKKK